MDVTFVRANDGAPYATLGPEWSAFNEALQDAVGLLPPRGSSESSASTYWIDRALRKVRQMVEAGESGPFQGGNTTTLAVRDGYIVATSDYELFDAQQLAADAFVAVLGVWRAEVLRVRDAEQPAIPETYRRNPYPD